uniref:ATP synthase F0 subunit 8 n=1 Tax=Arria pura TaxID=2908859 RepID=UPI00300175B8
MPQMMPLNWFLLYTFFTLLMIMINVMNFYISFNMSPIKLKYKTMVKKIIWKW